jgi:predicted MFS family arabinose efflux permease
LACGFGASGLLMPVVVQMVDKFGWRESSIIFGVIAVVLCLPLASIVKDPPGFKNRVLENPASPSEIAASNVNKPAKVLKSKNFWLLSTAVLFGGVAGTAVIVHQIPYLVSVGITRQTAGMLALVLAASSVVGRLFIGYLGDKVEKRYCFAISATINAIGVLIFAVASTPGQIIPSLIAMGIGYGGLIPLRPVLQAEFFGMKSFATIQGFLMLAVTIGTIVSPIFAGWMFDMLHSYRLAFLILAAVTLLAIPFVLTVHKEH